MEVCTSTGPPSALPESARFPSVENPTSLLRASLQELVWSFRLQSGWILSHWAGQCHISQEPQEFRTRTCWQDPELSRCSPSLLLLQEWPGTALLPTCPQAALLRLACDQSSARCPALWRLLSEGLQAWAPRPTCSGPSALSCQVLPPAALHAYVCPRWQTEPPPLRSPAWPTPSGAPPFSPPNFLPRFPQPLPLCFSALCPPDYSISGPHLPRTIRQGGISPRGALTASGTVSVHSCRCDQVLGLGGFQRTDMFLTVLRAARSGIEALALVSGEGRLAASSRGRRWRERASCPHTTCVSRHPVKAPPPSVIPSATPEFWRTRVQATANVLALGQHVKRLEG